MRHWAGLALVALLAARELGFVQLDLSQSTAVENMYSSSITSPEDWPARPLDEIHIEVLGPGEGPAVVEELEDGGVRVTVAIDPIEVSGVDWLPLFKQIRYSTSATAGMDLTPIVDREDFFLELTEGSPMGVHFRLEGERTVIGVQARHSLHQSLDREVEAWVRESLTEKLREADSKAQAERAALSDE